MTDESNTKPAAEPATTAGAASDAGVPSQNPYAIPPVAAATNSGGWTWTNSGQPGSASTDSPPGASTNAGPAPKPGGTYGMGAPPQGYRTRPPGMPSAPDSPSPALAATLGLIPGVGAMYNGQFAKGLAHLGIFAILVSLSDNVNGIFGLFVTGWVFYQAFEAYHTARARRDGLPLPNAFGLNDIGERLGFGRNWPNGPARPTTGAAAAAGTGWAPRANDAPPPASASASWAGYVPPTAFPGAPPPSAFQSTSPTQADPSFQGTPRQDQPATPPAGAAAGIADGWGGVPYRNVADESTSAANFASGVPFAGPSPDPSPGLSAGMFGSVSGSIPGSTITPSLERRFPISAVLLIVLGGAFLLSNVAPAWHLNDRWLLPLLLTSAAVWVFVRRFRQLQPLIPVSPGNEGPSSLLQLHTVICALRLPALLLVLAVMFALNAGGWLTIGQSWPLLLIALGLVLLLERTLGRSRPPTASSGSEPLRSTPDSDLAGSGRA